MAAAVCSLLILAAAPTLSRAAVQAGSLPQAASEADRHVFIEVSTADAGRPVYVQQQVPYTVRLYVDDTVRKGQLDTPHPADAVVEQLGEDQRGTAVRGGRSFNVIERHYAIAPEKSGTLRIPPVTFNGSQTVPESATGQAQQPGDADPGDDLFARMLRNTPFANDPLIRRAFTQGMGSDEALRPISAQSGQVVVDVKPRPAAAGRDWLPAEAITLHDSWRDQPPQLKAGEPATRTITIEARGLSASQIPPLAQTRPANARLYPEAADNQSHTDGKTVTGISQQKLTYIPDAQGQLDVPAIELPWWDVAADAPRVASLPSMSLNVAPNAGVGASAGAPVAAAPAPVADAAVAGEMKGRGRPALVNSLVDPLAAHPGWIAGAALLAALLAAGGIASARSRRQRTAATDAAPEALPGKAAGRRALKQACAANDPVAAAGALRDLGRAQWPDDPPRGLDALAMRLQNGAEEVRALNRSLYAPSAPPRWQGAALWHAMRGGLQPRRDGESFGSSALQALYPVATVRRDHATAPTAGRRASASPS